MSNLFAALLLLWIVSFCVKGGIALDNRKYTMMLSDDFVSFSLTEGLYECALSFFKQFIRYISSSASLKFSIPKA